MACGSCEYIKWKFDLERYSCAYRYMTSRQQGGVWVDVEIQPLPNNPTPELQPVTARNAIYEHLRATYGLVDGATECDPNGRCRCIRTGKYTEELAMRVTSAMPRPTPIPPTAGQQNWWECDISFVVVIRKLVAKGQCYGGPEGEQLNPPDDE